MTKPVRLGYACLLVASIAGSSSTSAAEDAGHYRLRIESNPPGAEVILIGGSAGHTPLTISERAIYPNTYDDEQASLYGLVTLRRDGCSTAIRRVTLDDMERGMHVTLDCDPVITATTRTDGPAGMKPSLGTGTAAETIPERRLRQLQVLQELLDEGLISAKEERRIRRQLLTPP